MKPLLLALWNRPALLLGSVSVAAPILVGAGVVAGWVGALAAALAGVATHQLVTPVHKK